VGGPGASRYKEGKIYSLPEIELLFLGRTACNIVTILPATPRLHLLVPIEKKVKQSHYRPGQVLTVPRG